MQQHTLTHPSNCPTTQQVFKNTKVQQHTPTHPSKCPPPQQVFKNNKVQQHIRTSDITSSNWVHYVNLAVGPHNLMACQVDSHIYLYTVKPIPPNVELVAWFSRDYADRTNCPAMPPPPPPPPPPQPLALSLALPAADAPMSSSSRSSAGAVSASGG